MNFRIDDDNIQAALGFIIPVEGKDSGMNWQKQLFTLR